MPYPEDQPRTEWKKIIVIVLVVFRIQFVLCMEDSLFGLVPVSSSIPYRYFTFSSGDRRTSISHVVWKLVIQMDATAVRAEEYKPSVKSHSYV